MNLGHYKKKMDLKNQFTEKMMNYIINYKFI